MDAFFRLIVRFAIAISVALGAMGGAHAERQGRSGHRKWQIPARGGADKSGKRRQGDCRHVTRSGLRDVVDSRQDVGVVEFKRAVREFLIQAASSDIAVVYYSGHGMEFDGSNYLIPIDAKFASAFDVDDETVSLERILASTEQVRELSLIILDACRDNPFLRGEPEALWRRARFHRASPASRRRRPTLWSRTPPRRDRCHLTASDPTAPSRRRSSSTLRSRGSTSASPWERCATK